MRKRNLQCCNNVTAIEYGNVRARSTICRGCMDANASSDSHPTSSRPSALWLPTSRKVWSARCYSSRFFRGSRLVLGTYMLMFGWVRLSTYSAVITENLFWRGRERERAGEMGRHSRATLYPRRLQGLTYCLAVFA